MIQMKDTQCALAGPGSPLLPRNLHKAVGLFLLSAVLLWAASGGSLSGTLKDASGAVVPGAKLTLVNTALKTEYTTTSDGQGFYSFPNLPVARYDLTVEATGFRSQKKTEVMMDTDAAIRVDAALEIAAKSEEVT